MVVGLEFAQFQNQTDMFVFMQQMLAVFDTKIATTDLS